MNVCFFPRLKVSRRIRRCLTFDLAEEEGGVGLNDLSTTETVT